MNNNFFSIIVCCYNSEKYIAKTLDSLLNQTYKNFEVVIIDDGSKDNTHKIILQYKDKFRSLIYYYHDHRGFAYSRNIGIKKAKYEWIAFLDHDDIAADDRIEIHNEQINSNYKSKLFFGNCEHFYGNLNIVKTHFNQHKISKYLLNSYSAGISLLKYGSFIPSSSVVFSKKSALSTDLFNQNYSYIGDYDFFIKMGLKYSFSYTNRILSYWRIHDGQATKNMLKIYNKEFIDLLDNYINKLELDFFVKLLISKRLFLQKIKSYTT